MEVTAGFWQLPERSSDRCRALARQDLRGKGTDAAKKTEGVAAGQRKHANAALYKGRWQVRHRRWRTALDRSTKPPYAAQWHCLDAVHRRCVMEHEEERSEHVNSSAEGPMLALLHAPPGHGKSQLIQCLRSYVEEVWSCDFGVQYVILAPMNTMAINVGGEAMHAWGEIPFCIEGTQVVKRAQAAAVDLGSMRLQCEGLRWLLIDEVENAGADALGILETHTRQAANKRH